MASTNDEICRAFRRNPDGSWTCVEQIDLTGLNRAMRVVSPGTTFRPTDEGEGSRAVAYLELVCKPSAREEALPRSG
jgi:hypothetical protein